MAEPPKKKRTPDTPACADQRPQRLSQAQHAEATWIESVLQWFPNLHGQTYTVPTLYIRRTACTTETVAGQLVNVPERAPSEVVEGTGARGRRRRSKKRGEAAQTSQHEEETPAGQAWLPSESDRDAPRVFDSDVRDDQAQELVLVSLEHMGRQQGEVMVVISQLRFGKYLNESAYAAAVEEFPRPVTLDPKYKQGEFDVLLLHRTYGIIVAEVRSLGCAENDLSKIINKVQIAVRQLTKAIEVLNHLVTDLAQIRVTPTVILPYVSSGQLLAALGTDTAVLEALCDCLGVGEKSPEAAVRKCLCADQMPASAAACAVTDQAVSNMGAWWRNIVAEDPAMTKEIYERLVARFCGPATTFDVPGMAAQRRAVQLRTAGQAAAETGRRMAQLTLLPDQVSLINDNSRYPKVFLAGPPGTGKTVVLVLKAARWLLDGHDVHVISSWSRGHAVALLIEHQLNMMLDNFRKNFDVNTQVCLHLFEFDDPQKGKENVDEAVRKLREAAHAKLTGEAGTARLSEEADTKCALYAIVDEAGPYGDSGPGKFQDFCDKLNQAVPDLHLWAGAVPHGHRPECLEEQRLTVSLRCPRKVMEEVEQAAEFKAGLVYRYSQASIPAPTDGLKVIHLCHKDNTEGHAAHLYPLNCELCGKNIAEVLKELDVKPEGQGALQYRDVLVLSHDPHDDRPERDSHGDARTTPVITGLRQSGFPVFVVQRDDVRDIDTMRDVALAKRDEILVTDYMLFLGLERRVVVGVGHVDTRGAQDRLLAMSRCTGQLVWVKSPHHIHHDNGEEGHHHEDGGQGHHHDDGGQGHHHGDGGQGHHQRDGRERHHHDDGGQGHHQRDGGEGHRFDDGEKGHHRVSEEEGHYHDDGDEGHHHGDRETK